VTRTPLSRSKGQSQLVADVLKANIPEQVSPGE